MTILNSSKIVERMMGNMSFYRSLMSTEGIELSPMNWDLSKSNQISCMKVVSTNLGSKLLAA